MVSIYRYGFNVSRTLTEHVSTATRNYLFFMPAISGKKLKGYLIYKGVSEPPKIHDLVFLSSKCSDFNERFFEIDKACSALNRYGVQPRYPNELGIKANEMQKAIEYAHQVRDFELLAAVRKEVRANFEMLCEKES